MNATATLTYKTPAMKTVIAGVIGLAAQFVVNILMAYFTGRLFGLGFFIIALIPCLTMSRTKVMLEADDLAFRHGFGQKRIPLRGGAFGSGHKTGFAAWLQSLSPRTGFLRIRQVGKPDMVLHLNLAREDFDNLMAAMRERGASLEAM